MAVYTTLDAEEIQTFVKAYGLGELLDFAAISNGMENSNYFVTTSRHHLTNDIGERPGHYVLTIFEELPEQQLPFHLHLLENLQAQGLQVAAALRDADGNTYRKLHQKPAILCPRLQGKHPSMPSLEQCAAIGHFLACFHLGAQNTTVTYDGIRSLGWLRDAVKRVEPLVSGEDFIIIEQVLERYLLVVNEDLPQGIIHGDLFRDNALFNQDKLQGVIDFFNAGSGQWLFDVAVTVNDWCISEHGWIDEARYYALLNSYAAVRPFTANENEYWSIYLNVCAMRFWVSRLLTRESHNNDRHERHEFKDPNEFRTLLLNHLSYATPKLP